MQPSFQELLAGRLDGLRSDSLLRRRRTIASLPDGRCVVDGRELLNFASNDYLGLAHDPRLIAAARVAVESAGSGSRASALVCGRTEWHERLEAALADFEGTDDAILFPSGYAANVGTLSALIARDDVVFCDRLNHASLIDGCRLSRAAFRVYRHDRLDVLERELAAAAEHAPSADGRRWIVTDSIFSMDGDGAPLTELCDLAETYGAHVIVDEAHATGVIGERGRGVCELQGVESRVAVRIGTLSKAVGCAGGFVAGPKELVQWLWNSARTQMFSTALPPSVCGAALEALNVIRSEPERREHLHRLAQEFRTVLQQAGVEPLARTCGPILPVIVHRPETVLRAGELIEQQGFLVGTIRPPTVPRDSSRLRITVSSVFELPDVRALAVAAARAIAEVRMGDDE